jgi:F0F1-type ATP synthase epsilon subunit
VAYPGIFFLGGVQQIQLTTENGDLGAVAPNPLVKVLEAAVIWYRKFHFI